MKFDKRISNDLRDVYTLYCRNNDNLLGIEVYASNDIDDFNNIDRCRKGKVEYLDPVHGYSVKIDSENTCYFNFVIPAMCVKEKTLRPYTLEEFQKIFALGKAIQFRRKDDKEHPVNLVFLGYTWLNDRIAVEIGHEKYFLDVLLNDFEWYNEYKDEYTPFGVAV
jgi:hypothetical protein